ncbi:MAG: hypothetical protein Q7S28_01370 [bacterium]|nr:hypothetical protein [bacterium]
MQLPKFPKFSLQFFIKGILTFLRINPVIGGFEISDTALRYVAFLNGRWELVSMRLPPGIIVGGVVKEYAQLVAALFTFRENIVSEKRRDDAKLGVVVSLSSISIYTQVFSLPFIEGENLEKAIQLNIQMVSPAESSQTYSGWQFARRDYEKLRLEVLSAFVNRAVVDNIRAALEEAGFLAIAVESRALSLVRLLKEQAAGFDPEKPSIVVSLDTNGIDFFVVRHGNLYFDYFTSWADLQGEERVPGSDAFARIVIRNFHQVLNFYNSHWPEPLAGVWLAMGDMTQMIQKIIKENFGFDAEEVRLTLKESLSHDWFIPLGGALRGLSARNKDADLSLLGIDAQEEFREEQLLNFTHFWRTLMPASMALLILILLGAHFFLINTKQDLEANQLLNLAEPELVDIQAYETKAIEFNESVAMLTAAEGSVTPKNTLIKKLFALMADNGITLSRLNYQMGKDLIGLSASAFTQDDMVLFKRALETDPMFLNVDLPLPNIQVCGERICFTINFALAKASPP